MSAARDQQIGKRAAVAFMLVTFVYVAIGPLWIAINGFTSLAMGTPGNMPDGPGVSTREQMAGNFPFPMPAWAHIVAMLPLPVILALIWKPSRHSRTVAFGGKLLLWATPPLVTFITAFCAIFAFDAASWFPQEDGSPGLHWIAGVIGAVTAIVGGVHSYRTRRSAPSKRRVAARRRPAAARPSPKEKPNG